MANKDMRELRRDLEREGWKLDYGKVSCKCYHPKGGRVTMSLTPSCHHAVANARADVNRLKRKHGEHT